MSKRPPAWLAKAPNRPRGHPEDNLQEAIVAFHRQCVWPGQTLLFAVPNGEKRDAITAARLTGISDKGRAALPDANALDPYGLGVVPGTADLVVLVFGGRTLLVELKTPRITFPPEGVPCLGKRQVISQAGKQDRLQVLFQAAAEKLGHTYHLLRSVEEYADLMEANGVKLRARPFGPGVKNPRPPA